MSTVKWTIGTIIQKTVPYLAGKGIPNPRLEADLMLMAVLDLPRVKLYSDWDRPLEPAEIQAYREIILRRVQGTPLAYLSGKKAFLSWDFEVTPAVLIPRPETELLVEAVVDRFQSFEQPVGVDVGTGSGVIAVSLAKLLPGSTWTALDISEDALAVAKRNADRLGVADRICFRQSDLLTGMLAEGVAVDVIVSNPPYIPREDIATLQPEVRKEPMLALDGGVDGMEIYRRLIPQAALCLKPGGMLALEHGFGQQAMVGRICEEHGFEWEGRADLSGIDRIVIAHKK
ncbi:MAG TPA: peptide chain release factor N(5)-glutamine methyltransferase [Bacillota bacterium]|nr:peptide chain release factor N(5)-glutamine methyltransferase [Bacillota bacterium]